MTKQEIQAIIDEINALEGEEKQAAIDAFKKISDARKAGGGMLPPEMEIEEDPDLIDPESENDITDGEDADIEDPEDVLRHKKRMSDSAPEDDEDEEADDEDDGMSSSSGGKSKDSDDDSDDESDDDSEDGESGEDSDDDSDDSSSKGKSGRKDNDEKSKGNGGDDEDDEESDEEGDDETEDDKEGKGKGKGEDELTDEEKKAQSDMADMLQDIFGDDFEKDETSAEDDDEDEEDDDDFGMPIGGGSGKGGDGDGDEESESDDNESEGDEESEGDDEEGGEAMPHGHDSNDNRIDYGKEDAVQSEGGEDTEGESEYGDGEWKETSSEGRHLTGPGQEADDEEDDEDEYEDDEDEYDFSGETGIGADDFKDKEKEEKKKNEFFRRKLTISRLNSALGRAKEIADAAKNEGLELHEADANSYKKIAEAERMLQELIDQYEKDLAAGELSDAEEFDDKVAAILDIIEAETDDEAMKRTKDKEDRVAEIEKDEEKTTISDLEAEDNDNRRADPNSEENKKKAERAKARLDAENKKKMKGKTGQGAFGGGPTRTMQQLKIDLEDALAEQVDIVEREYFMDTSWSRLDRHHPDLTVPGEFEDERLIPAKIMPTIDVYIDQSGSWGDDDVKKVLDALKSIDDLVYDETTNPEGKVILNVYYFGYQTLSQDISVARSQPGGESWDLCIENILSEPETKNVIFVTDSDITYDYGVYGAHGCINGQKAHIDGFVWWIWKNNYEKVPAATHALTGDLGYKEYILSNERPWWR